MKGIIFGAGSVGRGFIGELLADSGFDIFFVDIAEDVIKGINLNHNYPLITVYNEIEEVKWIENAYVLNSNNEKAVIDVVQDADIIATSLGAKVLPIITPLLVKALLNRLKETDKGINILLCENLHNVDKIMEDLCLKYVPEDLKILFKDRIAFLSTSIGRMIPLSSEETKKIHPAAIKVEPYKFLPYDGASIKVEMPEISNLYWDQSISFDYYSDRKLYIHNMGHCITAFLSSYKGYEYIWQAIYDPEIRYFVRTAMLESALALSRQYNQDLLNIIKHIDNLLMRFANKAIGDTSERVARDPARKLKADDRLLGAMKLCIDQDVFCPHITLGVAAGLIKLKYNKEFKHKNIESYLNQEIPWFSSEKYPDHYGLLERQVLALEEGFDFDQLVNILDSVSPKNIP